VQPESIPTSGDVLLNDVVRFVRRFVVLNDEQATAVALWVTHTHALEAFDVSPYLAVTSAEKRCGKTRLFDVLELVVARAWRVIMPSEAIVYRKVDAQQPTLMLDEADAIFGPKANGNTEGLRALLNAGNRRGTTVPRCVGPSQTLTDFKVFSAKAVAGIGELPDTVADRAIPIRLKRRAPDELVERFRRRDVEPEAAELHDRVADWLEPQLDELRRARPELPDIDDRAQDSWEPLLAIADLAGGDWITQARAAAAALSLQEDDEESHGVRLLADVQTVFQSSGVDKISSKTLVAELCELEEAPWGDWGLSQTKLAHRLRAYGIRSRNVRLEDGTTPKGYRRESFEDAWARYLPIQNATTPQPAWLSQEPLKMETPQTGDVALRKQGANPHEQRDVADVALRNADNGAGDLRDVLIEAVECLVCERPYTPDDPCSLRCRACRERSSA